MRNISKSILYLRTDICGNQINVGGSVGHTLGVIAALQDQGYSIRAFSSQMHGVLQSQRSLMFVPLKTTRTFTFLRWQFWYLRWRLESFFSTFFFFFSIVWRTRKQQFSYIYQRYSILNFTGVLLAWYFKIPLVLEYNGSEAYWFNPSSSEPWYIRWFACKTLSYWVEFINVKYAHTIVAVSQVLKDDLTLRGIDPHKILVNPNGVNVDFFHEKSVAMELKESLEVSDCSDQKFTFGFIGTFGHWHGIEVLEYIIPKLCERYPQVDFLLIGDGVLKERAQHTLQQQIAAGQCVFTGRIAQNKAPEYLSLCDAFLCPTQPNADGTRFFGSPTKLFEYMSMGRPVIASQLEQVGEVVSPAICVDQEEVFSAGITNQVGFVFDPLDWDACYRACVMCLEMSDADREKIGANARKKVIENYTWKKHVQKILEHIKQQ